MDWLLLVERSLKKNRVPDMSKGDANSEKGVVTALQDNEAIIEFNLQEACESCGARMVCVPDNTGKRRLRASNPLHASVGNFVSITEKSHFLLLISFLQYGLPLIFFFISIFILYFTDFSVGSIPRELIWFIGGLLGLTFAALISRHFVDRLAEKGGTFFEISQIIS
jgi:positive regulator of sigma E activity